jgi:hypothetical protein
MRAVVVYSITGESEKARAELLQMIEDLNNSWSKNKRIVYVDLIIFDKENDNTKKNTKAPPKYN